MKKIIFVFFLTVMINNIYAWSPFKLSAEYKKTTNEIKDNITDMKNNQLKLLSDMKMLSDIKLGLNDNKLGLNDLKNNNIDIAGKLEKLIDMKVDIESAMKASATLAQNVSNLEQTMKAGRDVNNTTNDVSVFKILAYTSLSINAALTGIIVMVIKLLFGALASKEKYKLNKNEYDRLKYLEKKYNNSDTAENLAV
jgi:hypothetical protein